MVPEYIVPHIWRIGWCKTELTLLLEEEKYDLIQNFVWVLKRDVLCSHYTRLDEAFNNSLGVSSTEIKMDGKCIKPSPD